MHLPYIRALNTEAYVGKLEWWPFAFFSWLQQKFSTGLTPNQNRKNRKKKPTNQSSFSNAATLPSQTTVRSILPCKLQQSRLMPCSSVPFQKYTHSKLIQSSPSNYSLLLEAQPEMWCWGLKGLLALGGHLAFLKNKWDSTHIHITTHKQKMDEAREGAGETVTRFLKYLPSPHPSP